MLEIQPQNITFQAFQNGKIKDLSLISFIGKWLLLFFYKGDFDKVVESELKTLASKYEDFKSTRVEIVAISRDSITVHQKWVSSLGISDFPITLGSDINGEICKTFNVLEPDGYPLNASIILDPDEKIVFSQISPYNVARNIDEILRNVQAMSYIRSKGNKVVCLTEWTMGQEGSERDLRS